MKNLFLKIVAFILVLFSFQNENEKVVRMYESSVLKDIAVKVPRLVEFHDTLHNDTLWEHLSADNFPIMYSRKITTGVCIKGECRPVNIELFWNCTGRYLGFELPHGEFLSKTEHVRFNQMEYDRLHELMADRNSPLATYTLEELVVIKDTIKSGVDAVTSATIKAVMEYIVEGAVYTTYTLWQIVNGQTYREIEKITSERLTDKYVSELLESSRIEDQIWTLNHISARINLSPALQNKLMELISGQDVYLAERSLNAIKPEALTGEVQSRLISVFDNTGFLQKRFILQKLKDAPDFSPELAVTLSGKIINLNATLIKLSLELFEFQKVDDETVNASISKLLKNENRYISNLAIQYLENKVHLDKKTSKELEKYQQKQ